MNPMKIQEPISSVNFPDSHELEHAETSIKAEKKNKLLHLLPPTIKKVARHVVGFYFRGNLYHFFFSFFLAAPDLSSYKLTQHCKSTVLQ